LRAATVSVWDAMTQRFRDSVLLIRFRFVPAESL
jgi:hypothetical protein